MSGAGLAAVHSNRCLAFLSESLRRIDSYPLKWYNTKTKVSRFKV